MMLNANEWAVQQWAQADLGDKRRTRRAVEIGVKMATYPEASLSQQMGSRMALKGAYLLLNNAAITLEALLKPHGRATADGSDD